MNSTRQTTLILYKQLLRECHKFTLYNYREYFLRRVRDEFHQNRNLRDSNKIAELIKRGEDNLRVIRRQALIENLYAPGQPSILEKRSISTSSIPS